MSKPGSPMAHQDRATTLDAYLKAQYGIQPTPLKLQVVRTSKRSELVCKILIGLAVLALLTAAMPIYLASITGPMSWTLLACSGVVDVGLYLFGFLSAYAYAKNTFNVPLHVIDWLELVPGIIYFGLAWYLIHWKQLPYTGLTAIILFWAFGFLTSPPVRGKVGPILATIGKLIRILPPRDDDKAS